MYEGDEVKPGQFEIGNYLIDISEQGNSMVITINDMFTGNQTEVEVPYY